MKDDFPLSHLAEPRVFMTAVASTSAGKNRLASLAGKKRCRDLPMVERAGSFQPTLLRVGQAESVYSVG